MSTAGKVLTVLVLLVTVVWIVMMSAVAQLNVNWEDKIAAQEKDLERVTKDYTKAKGDALTITEQARAKQDEMDREKLVLEKQEKDAERRRSSTIEDLSRVQKELDDMLATAKTAKADLATREAEKIANQEALAKKRDEITKAQAANAELKTQLAQLQDDFKRILAENVAKLDKIAKEGVAKPASASSVRQPPSS